MLDGLEGGELLVLRRHLGLDERDDLRILLEVVEAGEGDALLLGVVLDVLLLQGYQGAQVLAPVPHHTHLADVLGGADQALDGGGGHVLAPRRDDEVLLAPGDAQEVLRVDLTQVARVQPAFGADGGGGLLGHLVVLLHHVAAAIQDLPIGADHLLDPGSGRSHPPEAEVVHPVDVGEGGVLGHADALQDEHPGGVEETGDVGVEGSGSRDAPAHPPAEGLVHLGEDQLGGDAVLGGGHRRDGAIVGDVIADLGAHLRGPSEDLEGHAPLGLGTADDARVHLLVDAGNACEPEGTGDLHVVGHRVQAPRHDQSGARVQRAEDDHPGEDVGQGQKEQGLVAVVHVQARSRRLHGEGEVVVGEHRALGHAGGARRVDDARRVRGRRDLEPLCEFLVGHVVAEGQEALEAHGPVIVAGVPLEQHHLADVGDPVPDLAHLGELRLILREQHHRVGVVGDVGAVLGKERLVDAHRARADGHDREVGEDPAIAGVAEDVHLVPGLDPEGDEGLTHPHHLRVELGPRDRAQRAVVADPPIGRPVRVGVHREPQRLVHVLEVPDLHGNLHQRPRRSSRSTLVPGPVVDTRLL